MINGAKWWKFDFHCHTPASNDYGKGIDQEILKSKTPREWLLDYMRQDFDCVAVTDHNSGAWIDILKHELTKMEQEQIEGYRPIIIYPGVEISVNGGIHVLALFDPSKSSSDIMVTLRKAGYDGDLGDTDQCTSKSLNDVLSIITKDNGIAIPAHVDEPSGIFNELNGVTLKSILNHKSLLSIELCNLEFEKPTVYRELKLNLTEVVGSDSHRPEQIGRRFTWVKMEKPSIDALRLALHDGEDGVLRSDATSDNPNSLRDAFYIKNVIIKNGAKAGRGEQLKVNFSPWFTTLIGGRGSGKSSILEYLRLPLNNRSDIPKSLNDRFERFAKISSRGQTGMLTPETEVRVELFKDRREIALTWKDNTIFEEIRNNNGDWESQGESSLPSERFPIQIYSQKQLYEMTKDRHAILNLIDKQFNKQEWLKTKEDLQSQWLDMQSQRRKLKLKLTKQHDIRMELKDIEAKLKIYDELGHKKTLDDYKSAISIDGHFNIIFKELIEYEEYVTNILKKVRGNIHFNDNLTAELDDESAKIIHFYKEKWNKIENQTFNLVEQIAKFRSSFENDITNLPWQATKNQKIKNYEYLIGQLNVNTMPSSELYETFIKRKTELENELKIMSKVEEEYKESDLKQQTLFENIIGHEKKLREQRNSIILNWNQNNSDIKIILDEMGDLQLAEKEFRSLIRREGTVFSKDICELDDDGVSTRGFLHNLMIETKSEERWESRSINLKNLLTAREDKLNGYSKNFIKHIHSLRDESPEDIDRVAIWFPEDRIILKLMVRDREQNIDIGSAGQRTAAILSLLLSLEGSPLIIDQPEDDLDTKRITDLVVKGIRKLKVRQQVIVITHNPNIPVNGGAEQIVHLNFASGLIRVAAQGALQNKEVRQAVCDVMEGGSEALSSRYYRIFKALQEK